MTEFVHYTINMIIRNHKNKMNKNSQLLTDRDWMAQALSLAEKGIYTTDPNPNVGCVIVREGEKVGEGFHCQAGSAHAEVLALRQAQEKAKGATVYVTLEPCAHYGKTPPCALALILAQVRRVVIGQRDPNPKVSGQGIALLKDAGIEVDFCTDFAAELEALNAGFLKRMRTGLPFVRLKLACSLDGKIALENGESQWITSRASRQDVQTERAKASLILSTSQTVIEDQATLTVRKTDWNSDLKAHYPLTNIRQPIRCILDQKARLTGKEAIFNEAAPIWLVRKPCAHFPSFVQFLEVENDKNGKIDLAALFKQLGDRGINTIWVEAGAQLAGALIQQRCVDELILYYAPKLLGHRALSAFHFELNQLSAAPEFQIKQFKLIEETDLKLILVLTTPIKS